MLHHPFGDENDIHRYFQRVHKIEKPVVQYQKGAGLDQQSLTMDDEYLQSNFPEDPVVCFPPGQLRDNIDDDDFVGQLLLRYNCNFIKNADLQYCRRIMVHINKQRTPLLVDRFGFVFQGDELIMTFDEDLNIITVTAFSSSTTETDVHRDLKHLEKTLKSFVMVSADLLADDVNLNKHVTVIGILCLTSTEVEMDMPWLPNCSETFCVKNFLTRHELRNQENFDSWYKEVSKNIFC